MTVGALADIDVVLLLCLSGGARVGLTAEFNEDVDDMAGEKEPTP